MHDLGGLLLLVIALAVFGLLLGRQGARTWDVLRPGTRPSRQEAQAQAVAFFRSGTSAARAGIIRAMPSGVRDMPLLGVVLGTRDEPLADDDDDPDDESPAPEVPARPQPARPAPPASWAPTGRTAPVSTPAASARSIAVPGAEEMATGMARLRSWAVNGNAEQKEAAFAALSEVWQADAALIIALARSMSEDSKFSTGITEEVEAIAPVLSALSMRAAEVEGRIGTLLNQTGRELIESGQAPERRELMAEPGSL